VTELRAGAATDVGLVRANNQDQLLLASPVFAVADGMGGHAAGEVASLTAVEALRNAFQSRPIDSPEALAEGARAANRAVWDAAQGDADLQGMGTTLTALALVPGADGAESLAVVNVGDSRTYLFHDGDLEQVTLDHSYVAELVAEGRIDAAEAEVHPQRHVLTRALGVAPAVDVDLMVLRPEPGDRYILCSDGLSREVTDNEVAAIVGRLADPGDAARELVATAKLHGGADNITVVVVDIVEGTTPAPVATGEPTTAVLPSLTAADLAGPADAGTPPADPDTAPDRAAADGPASTAAGDTTARATGPLAAPSNGTSSDAADGAPGGGGTKGPGAPVEGRRARRQARRARGDGRARLVTGRVVIFFVALVAILVIAGLGTAYYARSTYYVGLRGGQVTIFKGRPGGVLWWKPTTAKTTDLASSGVLAFNLPALRAGVQESTLGAARSYVANLRTAKAAATPATTVPPTTVPPTTVPPRTPTTVRHHRTTTRTTTRRHHHTSPVTT
jgi:serine/threonine protein phosphatase PrpC